MNISERIKESVWQLLHPWAINIHGKWSYPSCALSNFAAHKFVVDGVECNSMEGFLQSLKFADPKQQEVCRLTGIRAKRIGREKNWTNSQTLYWQGVTYHRESVEYLNLLNKAYSELFLNEDFRKALAATRNRKLRHTVGVHDPQKTVLTETEFCKILSEYRTLLI